MHCYWPRSLERYISFLGLVGSLIRSEFVARFWFTWRFLLQKTNRNLIVAVGLSVYLVFHRVLLFEINKTKMHVIKRGRYKNIQRHCTCSKTSNIN